LGKRIRISGGEPCEILGVVKDERFRALDADPEPIVYVPYQQGFWWLGKLHPFNLMVHTQSDPASVVNVIRGELHAIDKDLALSKVKALDQLVAQATWSSRLSTQLLAGFALLALGLSMLGTYGILSYVVGQATRDIGIRMALGARSTDVVCLIIRQGLGLVLVGLVIGLGGALALSRTLSSLLYGVSATDPVAFASAAVLFCLSALLACFLPARRAAKIHPMAALRCE
jgi:putative ABC transport system permease protein